MSLDGEPARQDETPAALLIRNALRSAMCGTEARDLAIAHFDALLAKLEQAERLRDEALEGRDDLPMAHEILVQLKSAEARLAKVPALLAAMKELVGQWDDGSYYVAADDHGDLVRDHIIPALLAWEGEPPPPSPHAPSKPRPSSTG